MLNFACMKHHIPSSFFTGNRKRLAELTPAGSVSILNSNDVLPTNADGTFRFRQNNDLYYLTGITQEGTVLLLFPSHPDPYYREIIFVEEPNEIRTKWDGSRLSKDEVSTISGITHVRYEQEFEKVFNNCVYAADCIYLNAIEHTRASINIQTRDNRFTDWCKTHYPLHTYKRLAPLITQLRMIKQPVEINLLKQSATVTEKGFRRVLRFLKPGVTQKQVEAEMIHEYLFNGADWADYAPIVSSGSDTCILHCNNNEKICNDGELVLIDAAASCWSYNSDLTRTVPVNGKYTMREKQVYNAVLRVHKAMLKAMTGGKQMRDLQQYCFSLLTEELMMLGLFSEQDLKIKGQDFYMNQYCYHNFSHFIGLDVHDVGDFNLPLQAGMVLTNEPGIYIREEGIGVRIENNILITQNGNEDLMSTIPVEVEEIEELMMQ